MDSYQIKAYAKINLGLDVLGRLENGYHLVKMVMQTVDLYDELELARIPEGIRVTTDSDELTGDEDNLVYKAARIMMEEYRPSGGVHIHLRKRIPMAAGMAGGSSDAAATFKGMNRLLDLGAATEDLIRLGVRVGADVPYCIMGGTALAEGIGERLTCLEPAPECIVLVAKPPVGVSTKEVYQAFDSLKEVPHPDIDGMVDAIRRGSLQGILDRMGNVLEHVTVQLHPVIASIKERMKQLGALNSLMSGSGPTVFGIFIDRDLAQNAYETMRREGMARDIFITEFHS